MGATGPRSVTLAFGPFKTDYGFHIPPAGELDFLALGALVHRLDTGVEPFARARQCGIHVSGGEFNTAASLASCFRQRTAVAAAMVDYPVGDLTAERVRAMGVQPFYKRFTHDGVTGPNMATVYSDRGFGIRPPMVFYNRANEAAARLKPGDFDWSAIFSRGVRWFHSGGIFASLSETAAELIVEAMRDGLLRSQRPREAVESSGRLMPCPCPYSAHRRTAGCSIGQ